MACVRAERPVYPRRTLQTQNPGVTRNKKLVTRGPDPRAHSRLITQSWLEMRGSSPRMTEMENRKLPKNRHLKFSDFARRGANPLTKKANSWLI
jgi:hypothetical protein